MKEKTTGIFLTDKEIEVFMKFRRFQLVWERLFDKHFTGSLTLHIQQGNLKKNEWRIVEEVIHS